MNTLIVILEFQFTSEDEDANNQYTDDYEKRNVSHNGGGRILLLERKSNIYTYRQNKDSGLKRKFQYSNVANFIKRIFLHTIRSWNPGKGPIQKCKSFER